MASKGYQYECRRQHIHARSRAHTDTHTNTWSQLTGAKDNAVGVKF